MRYALARGEAYGQHTHMRFAPTSRPLIWSLAVAIGVALVGCASESGGEGEAQSPVAPAENDATAAPNAKGGPRSGDDSNKPAFDPDFEDDGSSTNDPTKDPTPPGGQNACIDKEDPGGAENLAKKLADTDDCDNDLKEVSGVANGGVDVDFYSVSTTDKGISLEHPGGCSRDTDFSIDTSGTELCVWGRCRNGKEDAFKGCEEGEERTNALGIKGCCTAGPGRAVPTVECGGLTDNDSTDYFISVKQTNNGEKCLPYKIKYRY
jgi:hypothetical protein